MAQKQSFPTVVLGPAIAAFAYIDKPDTEGKYASGKYKVTSVFEGDDDLGPARAAAEKAAIMKWGKVPEELKLSIQDGNNKQPKDGVNEWAGKFMITAQSKFQPGVFNASREQLDPAAVKSGDTIKACVVTYPYEKTETIKVRDPKTKKTVEEKETVYGVSFQLRSIQLLVKNASGAGSADDFADESGEFEDVSYTPPAESGDSTSAPDGGGSSDDF